MALHNELGKEGEVFAVKFIEKKGLKIVAKNWRFGKNEIDIIANDKDVLVIVEVKTRTESEFFNITDLITRSKERFLTTAAQEYIQQNEIDADCRFDLLVVVKQGNGELVAEHIENAFYSRA